MRKKSLLGLKRGLLTVVAEAQPHRTPKGKTLIRWLCKCECGNQIECYAMHLMRRKNMSCGCVRLVYNRKYDPITASATIIYKNGYNDGDISFEEFMKLSQLPCHYCGTELSNAYQRYWKRTVYGLFKYNGLDRVDSSKPHNKDNVVPCCKLCNWAKRDLSTQEFLSWVQKVYKHTNNVI